MTTRHGRRAIYVLTGLLAYALFLLINLPASTMHELLTRVSRGTVAIQQPQGSFWNGSGELVVRSQMGQPLRTRLTWSIEPLWLFAGKVQTQLQASGDAELQGTIRIGYRQLTVSNATATLNAEAAGAFYAPLSLAAPTGSVRISTEHLQLDSGGLQGVAQLTWLNAGSRMSGLSDLGDYRLSVAGAGATATIGVETVRGEVAVNGEGKWQVTGDGSLRLDGTITPGSREPALAPLLSLIGARRNGNQYAFGISTRLLPPLPGS